ncbi:MAG: hypothetical protein AB8H80_19915 [Planctomycetota bacterium]
MLLLAAAICAACQTAPLLVDDRDTLATWRRALPESMTVRAQRFDSPKALSHVGRARGLLVVDPNLLPHFAPDPQQLETLAAFVAAGGRVCLFGQAARLVCELGLETEQPECEEHRWGFDRRSVTGEAEQLLFVTSDAAVPLVDGLTASVAENAYALAAGGGERGGQSGDHQSGDQTGDEPAGSGSGSGSGGGMGSGCSLPRCSWRLGPAQNGSVWARFGELRDGRPAPLGAPVLLHYRHGRGEVLACGVLPAVDHDVDRIRSNARGFVQRCAAWALRQPESRSADTGAGSLVLLELERAGSGADARADDAARPQPSELPRGGPPIRSRLAHWGWQAALFDDVEADAVRPVEELLREALLPSWQCGADLFQIDLADADHTAPLPWSERDPIARPATYRGSEPDGFAAAPSLRALAAEAHSRGLLAFAGLDPLPVGERPTERLVVLRRFARDLADARRFGDGAFDGFGLRDWWQDDGGYGTAMLHDFQPGGQLYAMGERVPVPAGALRALDADDGGLPGLPFAGLVRGWRDGFRADRFPLGVLDARMLPDTAPGVGVRGGQSHADWLVRQWNDFVRERSGRGAAVWWRRQDPRTLGLDTMAYVHGLGLEPLCAAVAMPLGATGRDGLRAAARELVASAPATFAAGVDAPAVAHSLQNNWFQLLGSGGSLQFDPSGTAMFGATAERLSPGMLHTRLFGGRPDGAALQAEQHDFLQGGRRGEGDYSRIARCGDAASAPDGREVRAPGMLAADQEPNWPAGVEFEWPAGRGVHELVLRLRGDGGAGLVAVSLDGVLLRCLSVPAHGRAPELRLPVHIARAGLRVLRVELLHGFTVAIDELRSRRTGDVAVEAEVVVAAGSVAQVLERSWSSYHEERVTMTAMADLPGLVVRTQWVRAARGLQVERTLHLPRHARVGAGVPGDDPKARRKAFVLVSSEASVPDVVVVPLQLPRHDRLVVERGQVTWRSAPETGGSGRIGLLFWPHGRGAEVLPHAERLLDAVDRPVAVDLGPDRRASLASDLPIAQSRLVQIESMSSASALPFLVRERGFWTWRGSQPALGGGRWLRVHQEPGDVVEIVGGPAVLARTRPGPGSLRVLALEDPSPASVTAHVLQPSRLCAPAVVMAMDFDEVLLDGQPWAHFDGRRVFLPDRIGSYRIETSRLGPRAAKPPHVRSTQARLRVCHFDPRRRELVLVASPDPGRPDNLPWTAVLAGPVPTGIDNGEIVAADQLHLPDAMAEAAAMRGGVLIRFRSGKTTVRYTAWNELAGR